MQDLLKTHLDWFEDWASEKIKNSVIDPFPLELKKAHTLNVYANAASIADFFPEQDRAAILLAALYHDIARFDQYLLFGTFKDKISFNHGLRGVKILKKAKRLEGVDKIVRKKILTAVALHNRYALPKNLPADKAIICNIIRDADKLDILRVMDEHLSGSKPYSPTIVLGLPDDSVPGNSKVIEAVLAKKLCGYNDLKNVNDFRILLGSWFFDMHTDASRDLFIKSGHASNLLQALPDDKHYGIAKNMLLETFLKAGK